MEKVPDDWEGRIAWLKNQAAQVYRFNPELDYWEVKERFHFTSYPPFISTPTTERLKDAFQYEAIWRQRDPDLKNHRTLGMWPYLGETIQSRISDFFSDRGLHNFDHFDKGGWGLVFKAQDRESGRNRIARIGCDATKNRWREIHPIVLPLISNNYDDLLSYDDLKLEIMPEIVPLHKLPLRSLTKLFDEAIADIAAGTNIAYPEDLVDDDCESHNVGLLPDGKVVSFDPMFTRDAALAKLRKDAHDFTDEHKLVAHRLYGLDPAVRFF